MTEEGDKEGRRLTTIHSIIDCYPVAICESLCRKITFHCLSLMELVQEPVDSAKSDL